MSVLRGAKTDTTRGSLRVAPLIVEILTLNKIVINKPFGLGLLLSLTGRNTVDLVDHSLEGLIGRILFDHILQR